MASIGKIQNGSLYAAQVADSDGIVLEELNHEVKENRTAGAEEIRPSPESNKVSFSELLKVFEREVVERYNVSRGDYVSWSQKLPDGEFSREFQADALKDTISVFKPRYLKDFTIEEFDRLIQEGNQTYLGSYQGEFITFLTQMREKKSSGGGSGCVIA